MRRASTAAIITIGLPITTIGLPITTIAATIIIARYSIGDLAGLCWRSADSVTPNGNI